MTGPRAATLVAGAGLALYAALCVGFWADPSFRHEWDAALYALVGRSLAAGRGYVYLGEPFFVKPPGVPWLVSLFGDGPFDPEAPNRTLMALAAGAAAAAAWAIARGRSLAWGAAAALLAGTSPGWLQHTNLLVAEFPFMACAYLALAVLAGPPGGPRRGVGRALAEGAAGGALLAGAILFRSVGLLFLPGVLLVAGLRRRPGELRRGLLAVVLCLALCAPWLAFSRRHAAAAPTPSEQLLVFDYATALLRTDPRDPASPRVPLAGWLARVASNGAGVLRDLGRNLVALPTLPAGAGLAALLLLGWLAAVRAAPGLLEWVFASYVGLLLVYFTYDPRLLVPLLPLVYHYALLGVRAVGERLGRPAAARVAVGAAAVALAACNGARLPTSLDPARWDDGATVAGWQDQRSAAAWLARETAPDAVVLGNAATVLSLLSGREVRTYRFAPLEALLERHRPDYVVLDAPGSARLAPRVAPRACARWRLPRAGGGSMAIFRLRGCEPRTSGRAAPATVSRLGPHLARPPGPKR